MTYGHLQADCLYTGISSGPNARYRVWEAVTFFIRYSAALETDNFLIVADTDLHNVYHVEYATGDTTQLLQYDEWASPFAVAYDPNSEMVYWSDHSYKTINCYSLLSRNSSTIYKRGQ